MGPLVAQTEKDRADRQAHLQQAEADFESLPFDASAARAFGQVAASLRRSGRKTTARSFDAMFGAIALANGLPLYTCNPDDFAGFDGLVVVLVAVPSSTAIFAELMHWNVRADFHESGDPGIEVKVVPWSTRQTGANQMTIVVAHSRKLA